MREILFRGKSVNGYWIYGNFNFYPDINRTFIRKNNKELLPSFQTSLEEEVSKNTVGQYTGLLDKNGTKIFEGDISKVQLQVPYLPSQPKTISAVGVVEFNTEKSCYYVVSPSGEEYALCFIDEVIGKIHDNPELLKVGEGYKVYNTASTEN